MNTPEQEKFDPRSLYKEDDNNNQAMLENMANNQNPFANYNPQNSSFDNAFKDDDNKDNNDDDSNKESTTNHNASYNNRSYNNMKDSSKDSRSCDRLHKEHRLQAPLHRFLYPLHLAGIPA